MFEKLYKDKRIWTLLFIGLGLLAMGSLVQGCKNAILFSQDFQWDAAKAFVMKVNPYLESMSATKSPVIAEFEKYYLQMEANQFPSLLMILIPYTFLPPLIARYVWLGSNLIFTAAIIVLLRGTFLKKIDFKVFVLLVLMMISGTPYRNQLGVGQHTLFSFTFFLLAVYFVEKHGEKAGSINKICIPAAFCLAISYFKYTLTVPLALFFVYRRKWKELIISVFIHIVLTIGASFWLGTSVIDMIIQPLRVSSSLIAEGGIDFGALLQGSPIALILAGVLMIILFIMVLCLPKGNDALVIGILTLWSLIITYHRTYDFFVLIIVAALFHENARLKKLLWMYAIVLVGVFYILRVFSEALPALLCVGTLYYAFTMCIMVIGVLTCRQNMQIK